MVPFAGGLFDVSIDVIANRGTELAIEQGLKLYQALNPRGYMRLVGTVRARPHSVETAVATVMTGVDVGLDKLLRSLPAFAGKQGALEVIDDVCGRTPGAFVKTILMTTQDLVDVEEVGDDEFVDEVRNFSRTMRDHVGEIGKSPGRFILTLADRLLDGDAWSSTTRAILDDNEQRLDGIAQHGDAERMIADAIREGTNPWDAVRRAISK